MPSENEPLLSAESQGVERDDAGNELSPRRRRRRRLLKRFRIVLAFVTIIMVTINFVLSILNVINHQEHGVATSLLGTSLGGFAIANAFFVYFKHKELFNVGNWFLYLCAIVLNVEASFVTIDFINRY